MKTFYDVLNISRNASTRDIIIAYRKRCIETHPDKGGNEIDFLNVRKGYDILSNPEKRAAYDRYIFQKEKEELEKQIQELKKSKKPRDKEQSFFNTYSFIISFFILAIVAFYVISSDDKTEKVDPPRIETKSNDKPKYKYRDRNQNVNKDKDLKWIYNELSKNASIGSYNDFIEALKDPDMAKYYYNETKIYNLKIGTLDDFNNLIIREGIIDSNSPDKDIKSHNAATNSQGNINLVASQANSINRMYAYSGSTPNHNYNETIYTTGDSPYGQYYGKGQFDNNSLSKLTVINYSTKEAVVLLVTTDGNVVRNVYISNSNQYTLNNIPEGYYRIKVMYGNSWYSEKDNGTRFPKGGFMKNVSFSKSQDNDLFKYIFEETQDGISYPTYSITLHKVKNGNMRTESIAKDDFFGD